MSAEAAHNAHNTAFQLIGIPHEYNVVAGSLLVAGLLTAGGFVVRSRLAEIEKSGDVLPEGKITLVNLSTAIVSLWRGLLENIVGHGSEKYLPIVGATFLYVLLCNLLGLIPGFLPPTENFNNNLAMAVFVFVLYQFLGAKEHGFGYFKQFTGGLPPSGFGKAMTVFLTGIAGVIVLIELVGHIFRPASLTLRLWGNINGDHTLVGAFFTICPLVLPVVFLALGVFVCCVQAFVFAILSTVYIKLAVSHDH